jgi:hypothetical protein
MKGQGNKRKRVKFSNVIIELKTEWRSKNAAIEEERGSMTCSLDSSGVVRETSDSALKTHHVDKIVSCVGA